MFEEIPVEIGLVHEGERIRKSNMHCELGGPGIKEKFELVRVCQAETIVHGKISIIGPDLPDIPASSSQPFAILVEIAGEGLDSDIEGVLERRIHEYCNYIQGFMHLNQRYDIWCRLSTQAWNKGFRTLRYIGEVLIALLCSELPLIKSAQVTFFTDPVEIHKRYDDALAIYESRDARARGLHDEDVDVFYGCALCQSFAPTHVCVITPERYANCGAISWFDGRAAARIDPKGPIFAIEKGVCIDPVLGEYSGVNESARDRSMGEVTRVCLYSAYTWPHTSCGCFEGIAFFIPEVEGYGIVHRGFQEVTVNGLPFSTMADSTAGGRQVAGFHGISIEYLRSGKFLAAEGGYARVVWMPESLKEKIYSFIPAELCDVIPTEASVTSINELREFLKKNNHPVIQYWNSSEINNNESEERAGSGNNPVFTFKELPFTGNGIKITLKNAKIYAEKVIIEPVRQKRSDKGDNHE